MSSLLTVNDKQNVFCLNTHTGKRPLYGSLAVLYEKFPGIAEDINNYPLATIAAERGEEAEYSVLEEKMNQVLSSNVNQGPRLGQ